MIILSDYFGPWFDHKDATDEVIGNAEYLLELVNPLLDYTFEKGIDLEINPKTKTYISGTQYGGFRPLDCCEGAPTSSHKQGRGIDIYDPANALDNFLTDDILARFNLYREAPTATPRWCHLTDRAPKSGRRTFLP